ncbi:MAG: PH domain-containing protein [Balneolaceae bacterium]|nr:PH domain-containing protein [Balneolaceae bacterium]
MDTQSSSRKAQTLVEASFNPKIKTYINATVILICCITIFGIVLIPFWLIFGRMYLNRYFDSLFCELTSRALKFRKGVLFQVERTIPLDKIQDLTFREGPLLRYFGLSILKIETAGQSNQTGTDMSLIGIVDAREFREKVIDQRDKITDLGSSSSPTQSSSGDSKSKETLQSILETLQRIEKKI